LQTISQRAISGDTTFGEIDQFVDDLVKLPADAQKELFRREYLARTGEEFKFSIASGKQAREDIRSRLTTWLERRQRGEAIEGMAKPTKFTREAILENIENGIVGGKKEVGVLVDDTGNEILRKSGTKDAVGFTKEELKKFQGNTLTHNHPFGTQGDVTLTDLPLAGQDGFMMAKHGLREIRAVTPEHVYSLKPKPGKRLDPELIRDVWQSNVDAQARRLAKDLLLEIKQGKITEKEALERFFLAQTEHQHVAWESNASGLDLIYERTAR
jgi:hypothetical protein